VPAASSLGDTKVPKQTPATDSSPAGEEQGEQTGHPVLSRVDCVAHLLMSSMEHSGECSMAAEAIKSIEALTESIADREVQDHAEKNDLRAQLASLQRRLVWRTVALEILLLGVASICAVMWLTHWWPW